MWWGDRVKVLRGGGTSNSWVRGAGSRGGSCSATSSGDETHQGAGASCCSCDLMTIVMLLAYFKLVVLCDADSCVTRVGCKDSVCFFGGRTVVDITYVVVTLVVSELGCQVLGHFDATLCMTTLILVTLMGAPLKRSSRNTRE